jgi:hypothetical protein
MRNLVAGILLAGAVLTATADAAQEPAKSAAAADTTAAGATASSTAQPADEGGPAKRVTVTAGVDFASAYLFRGIYQEDRGIVVPPYADLGVTVYQGEGALKSVTLNGGVWNSLHSGPSGSGTVDRSPWYEADYYGSATFTIGKWKPGALFTSYTSPNDVFASVHELAGVLAYDDSASPFPLNPKAIVAFELNGQADGGTAEGTYLELGVRPVVPLTGHPRYALSLAVPVKLGLGLRDYYEGPTGSNRFGYFDLGGILSVPLAFMNGHSTWDLHGGVDVLWLGDNPRLLNGGDRVKPVFTVGVGVTY